MAANGIRSAGAGRPIGCDAWTGFLKGRHDSNPDSPAAARASLSGPAGGDRRFRRAPGCPAGVRALALSLVMLGVIDSAALAPLAFVRPAGSSAQSRSS